MVMITQIWLLNRQVFLWYLKLRECSAGMNPALFMLEFTVHAENVVKEKHCFGWKKKQNKPANQPAEHSLKEPDMEVA